MKPQVIIWDEAKATDAFNAHSALIKAEKADPALRDNAAWTVLRQDAFERFSLAFEQVRAPTWRCGHPKTPENTRPTEMGGRCLTCRRALERRSAERHRQRGKA